MIDHAQDIISLLLWMIVLVGASLISLLIWLGNRLQQKVDDLPEQVTTQTAKMHDDIVEQMRKMNVTHAALERDVREQITALDRRLTIIEVTCGLHHNGN